MGRTFKNRCREHKQTIEANKTDSKYVQHILETGHLYDSAEDSMDILHRMEKGIFVNILIRFCMHV
jgi:hypothetical protein